ncbi:MAG: hypothetical protein FWE82_05315 [Defluviitaleaceae bacterium]|nr:hypothetical protein [Defluviitaleaceae bacterium]
MAIGTITAIKLVLRYESGSYTFDKIRRDTDVTDDKLYDLAAALNSAQSEAAKRIIKVVTTHIA